MHSNNIDTKQITIIGGGYAGTLAALRLATDAVIASGGAINHFTAGLVATVLEQGWQDEYLDFLRETYRKRATALGQAIRQQLSSLTFREAQGGFFIWLELAEGVDAEQLLSVARPYKVAFQLGVKFSPEKKANQAMRLCFAFMMRRNWRGV